MIEKLPDRSEWIEWTQIFDTEINLWQLIRCSGGFYISYNGCDKPTHFVFIQLSGKNEKENTGMFYCDSNDFNDYYDVREMIRNNSKRYIFKQLAIMNGV